MPSVYCIYVFIQIVISKIFGSIWIQRFLTCFRVHTYTFKFYGYAVSLSLLYFLLFLFQCFFFVFIFASLIECAILRCAVYGRTNICTYLYIHIFCQWGNFVCGVTSITPILTGAIKASWKLILTIQKDISFFSITLTVSN